jgi:hypothetical protein
MPEIAKNTIVKTLIKSTTYVSSSSPLFGGFWFAITETIMPATSITAAQENIPNM